MPARPPDAALRRSGDGMDPHLLEVHALLEERHFWFVGRRQILQAALGHYLPARRRGEPLPRLLEVGCGTGGNLSMLARFGEATGMDSAALAVERARERGHRVLLGALPGPFPEGLGRFDVACLFDVLEHIDDDAGALASLKDLLVRRGLVFISVPALPWLWSRHDVSFGHRRRYWLAELRELVLRAGLEPLHLSYFGLSILPAVTLVRFAGRLLGWRSGHDFQVPAPGLNDLLARLFALEAPLVVRRGLPLGSSLLAVALCPG